MVHTKQNTNFELACILFTASRKANTIVHSRIIFKIIKMTQYFKLSLFRLAKIVSPLIQYASAEH